MPTGLAAAGGAVTNSDLKKASAETGDVLSGETFYSGSKELKTGSMPNQGSWGSTISSLGGSIMIPKGYHNGSGNVQSKTPNAAFAARIKATYGLTEPLNGNGARCSGRSVIASISGYFAWVTFNQADLNQTSFYFGWKNAGDTIATVGDYTPNWVYVIRIW